MRSNACVPRFLLLLLSLALLLPPAFAGVPARAQDAAEEEAGGDPDEPGPFGATGGETPEPDYPPDPDESPVGAAIREGMPAPRLQAPPPSAPAKAGEGHEENVYTIRYLETPQELVYDIDRAVLIDRVHVDRAGIEPVELRAAQVEVLVTPIKAESYDDYISVGEFELPPGEDPVACTFEPIEARYVKLIVTASWGGPVGKVTGVRIGRSGGSLTGTMVDADTGAPLSGAQVGLLSGGEPAATGADGRFDLPQLPAGAHRLVAWRAGYAPFVRTLEIDSTRSRSIEVRLTREATDLFGFVREESGSVIEGADVTVKDTMQSVRTDANGLYRFGSLRAGTVETVVAREGFRSATARVFVSPGRIARLDATLHAGTDDEPPVPTKLSPYAYLPSDPKSIGTPTGSFYLAFDEPVDRGAINIANYRLRAFAGDPATGTLSPHPEGDVAIVGISFHAGDPSGRTLRFHLACAPAVTAMPFLELTVLGVADARGNAIPEPGRAIRNYSTEDYRETPAPSPSPVVPEETPLPVEPR